VRKGLDDWQDVAETVRIIAIKQSLDGRCVNTMVLTRPTLRAIGVPFAQSLGLVIGLLSARNLLSQMDVPTR
jgi:hypothetical protein